MTGMHHTQFSAVSRGWDLWSLGIELRARYANRSSSRGEVLPEGRTPVPSHRPRGR